MYKSDYLKQWNFKNTFEEKWVYRRKIGLFLEIQKIINLRKKVHIDESYHWQHMQEVYWTNI